jgi:hypothetical protein
VAGLQPLGMIMVCIVNITNPIETLFCMHDYELCVNQKVISRFEKTA